MENRPRTPWEITGNREPFFKPLKGELQAEITVIGGGFTGVALAYHLKCLSPKMQVCLLEAERLGAGASGRTGGILMNGTASDEFPGTDEAVPSLTRTIREEKIECELRENGCHEMDRKGDGKWPFFEDYGRLRPVNTTAGGDFHPTKYLRHLSQRAAQRGVFFCEDSPVFELKTDGGLEVITAGGVVRADWVVATTNTRLLPLLGIAGELTPYQTYAIASEPVSRETLAEAGWGDERPFYTLSMPFLWGRTTEEGRILIGAGLSPIRKVKAEMLEHLEERFHNLHPAFERVKVEYRWWGEICIPHDWTPKILTSPLHDRILYLGGYAGHGCALSHLFAERVASYLAGNRGALELFRWARNGRQMLAKTA